MTVSGHPDMHVFYDYWGNKTSIFSLLAPHKELIINSKLIIRTVATSQIKVNFHSGFLELEQEKDKRLELLELLQLSKLQEQDAMNRIIGAIAVRADSVAGTAEAVCEYIFKHFKYVKGITTVETTLDEILSLQSGVCQDFVHLMLHILRSLGIPCRYVSGYICPNKSGMRGEGATHAWVDVWIPAYGWTGIDPTNNVWVTNKHVKLAVGRNFADCSPAKGSFKGPAQQKLSVYVSVGYEDGATFEDSNNVRTNAPEDTDPSGFANPEAQQQQ
jgi:transglutaminase-like putative cysteine protease